MSKKTFAGLAAVLAMALGSVAAPGQARPAHLAIQADHPVSPVSPTLYGLMTEEINYSYDGGLYAEMVRNRSFHADWSGILYWYLVENGNAAAKMGTDRTTGPGDAQKSSLKLEVETASAGNEAGVVNAGWWGMAVRPNTEHKGSFYGKAGGSDIGPVTVSLVSNQTGKALATATVNGLGTEWKQYEFTLKTGAAVGVSAANHLALTVAHPGTLWLDLVSLFPPTYHQRANGNRIDIMEKLAAMHPRVPAFSGRKLSRGESHQGTVRVEEDDRAAGGPAGAPESMAYHSSSDGMGLLEFLDWCEDLKMMPVLAVYAGYSLEQEHVNPGPDLEPYVRGRAG